MSLNFVHLLKNGNLKMTPRFEKLLSSYNSMNESEVILNYVYKCTHMCAFKLCMVNFIH